MNHVLSKQLREHTRGERYRPSAYMCYRSADSSEEVDFGRQAQLMLGMVRFRARDESHDSFPEVLGNVAEDGKNLPYSDEESLLLEGDIRRCV